MPLLTHRGDEGGGEVSLGGVRGDEERFDSGRFVVHVGHRHFVVQVVTVADSADDDVDSDSAAVVGQQAAGVGVEGRTFVTAERYMMWRKAMSFDDPISAPRILRVVHPRQAKELGRGVAGFDQARWKRADTRSWWPAASRSLRSARNRVGSCWTPATASSWQPARSTACGCRPDIRRSACRSA